MMNLRKKVNGLVLAAAAAVGLGVQTADANLLIDLRAVNSTGSGITINDPHSITLADNATGSITMNVFAVAGPDGNANPADERIQFTQGKIKSQNPNGNPLFAAHGSLTATI